MDLGSNDAGLSESLEKVIELALLKLQTRLLMGNSARNWMSTAKSCRIVASLFDFFSKCLREEWLFDVCVRRVVLRKR